MFRQVRYQTGEMQDIIRDMKNGKIPCMDVDNSEELEWFINELSQNGIHKVLDLPYDKDARDRIKEPEFEFRIAFSTEPSAKHSDLKEGLMFIDFYYEPDVEETYDSIFGD